MDQGIIVQIKDTLDKIRPFINRDGGDVEFVDFDEKTGTVFVRMIGACEGCSLIGDTLYLGIETILVEEVKGVNHVKMVNAAE